MAEGCLASFGAQSSTQIALLMAPGDEAMDGGVVRLQSDRPLEQAYGCRRFELAAKDDRLICRVPFHRGQPDWSQVLRELDSLGVGAPTPSLATFGGGHCTDGKVAVVEVRQLRSGGHSRGQRSG
jgi:hypothetical protein